MKQLALPGKSISHDTNQSFHHRKKQKQFKKRFFSRSLVTMISVKIEGLFTRKEDLLAELCQKRKCDILCIQEIHPLKKNNRTKIHGMGRIAKSHMREVWKCYICKRWYSGIIDCNK